MKIGVISTLNDIAWGGSEELWASMVNEALSQRLEVAVSVCHKASIPSKFSEIHENGVRVFRRRPSLWPRVDKIMSQVASPFHRIFRWQPDVICLSQGATYDSLLFSDLLGLLYAGDIPYVVVCQYNDDRVLNHETRESAKRFFARAVCVVFVSQGNLKSVERQLAWNLPNAIVLQNPVNLFDLTLVPWPLSGQVSMAAVARLEAGRKGQDILLEALASSEWRDRDWQLRLFGEGKDRKYLSALTEHYGLTQRVKFCGHVNDIRAIWEDNHLLVLPSRGEGTPLALVEAMLCGRPAVVTDVGGNTEWIEDGRTGFMAHAPTTKSFGAALSKAWLAHAHWQKMGLRARENALSRIDKSPGKSLLRVVLDAADSSLSNLVSDISRSCDECDDKEISLVSRQRY